MPLSGLRLFAVAAGLIATLGGPTFGQTEAPRRLFSFGAIADIQYADQPAAGAREYRQSIDKLKRCGAAWRGEPIAFLIQLGDLVDGGLDNLERILTVFQQLPARRYSLLGNHDLSAGREVLLQRLGMPAAYYAFTVQGWRFVVLDGMQVSVADQAGREMLASLQAEQARNAQAWNGAVGEKQREWLRQTLAGAAAKGEHAIVFCHFPVLAEACRPEHLLWDHEQVLATLESAGSLVAYLSGHDHQGGYAERNGVHYLTLPGMVEHSAGQSCKVVDVFPDRLVVRDAGSTAGQELRLRGR